MSQSSLWEIFKNNFIDIIDNNEYYSKYLNYLSGYNNNILLYGSYGFPTDLFIDEIVKKKFNIKILNKKECIWEKKLPYLYNQHFIEIDLMNPLLLSSDYNNLTNFIVSTIKNSNINNIKHCFIIKHIDLFNYNLFCSFKIIFEKYANKAMFICTTHFISSIDIPITSRFYLIRIKNFSHEDILHIYSEILKVKLNKYLVEERTRNIIKSIFISEVEKHDPEIVTYNYCSFKFPPLYDFIINFNKAKNNLEDIRKISYSCFQYNITISDICIDILKIVPNKKKSSIIKIASELEHKLNLTNNGREPIYIESLLCQILL
jgi:hypothetical protein